VSKFQWQPVGVSEARLIKRLLANAGASSERRASDDTIKAAEKALGVRLPEPYRQVLNLSDGLRFLDGHLRLLGTSDMRTWNDPETWKHAWPRPPLDFICFGGTSIGDQWAWRRADLEISQDAPVSQLDGFELSQTPLAASTTNFLDEVLPRLATTQIDDLVALARGRLGPVSKGNLLMAAPPAQFGLQGLVDRMTVMVDKTVMTALGDVARQLGERPGLPVKRFDTVFDDRGRPRLRLIFE
jgi:hypothetical protein